MQSHTGSHEYAHGKLLHIAPTQIKGLNHNFYGKHFFFKCIELNRFAASTQHSSSFSPVNISLLDCVCYHSGLSYISFVGICGSVSFFALHANCMRIVYACGKSRNPVEYHFLFVCASLSLYISTSISVPRIERERKKNDENNVLGRNVFKFQTLRSCHRMEYSIWCCCFCCYCQSRCYSFIATTTQISVTFFHIPVESHSAEITTKKII